jgi:hypothetical protein
MAQPHSLRPADFAESSRSRSYGFCGLLIIVFLRSVVEIIAEEAEPDPPNASITETIILMPISIKPFVGFSRMAITPVKQQMIGSDSPQQLIFPLFLGFLR